MTPESLSNRNRSQNSWSRNRNRSHVIILKWNRSRSQNVRVESEPESECKGGIGIGAETIRNRPSLMQDHTFLAKVRLQIGRIGIFYYNNSMMLHGITRRFSLYLGYSRVQKNMFSMLSLLAENTF